MGRSMARNQEGEADVELISLAIQRLMEEEEEKKKASDRSSLDDGGDNDLLLLSRLLSQVASMKKEVTKHSQISAQAAGKTISAHLETQSRNGVNAESSEIRVETERIVKELSEVKRQNFITHCLVSAMIILTVVWQLSEVSIILKVRDGLSNPFKFLGRILKKKTTSAIQNQIEAAEFPHLNMPALPHVNLPDFDLDG